MSARTFTGISPSFEARAIRHKPTGEYLPAHRTRWQHGYTYDEPSIDRFPRLFESEKSAKVALSAWLQGYWEIDADDGTPYPWKRQPGRRREDMEVVRFRLGEERSTA